MSRMSSILATSLAMTVAMSNPKTGTLRERKKSVVARMTKSQWKARMKSKRARKARMTKSQWKARMKSKRARKARRINRQK